ncbi:MAG: triacylglycerol lipase [Spirochaetaceae bacterium]|nr:triacylglycerol lipase [Spirochaetaceae bacterium]MCF7949606.1 triacylglycerol lipase [Spirochaetia bacterium]MCF7951514.1 triacylglycerol lipase [Spirochaetaceae bacterium]
MNRPIIFVHGFMGFGSSSETGISFPYWGGTVDLEERLRSSGFEVYTAEVGPVSSNWDRACELYAYIKGGVVDYGEAHSQKYGHARYGEYYPGVYPEWGSHRSVHLVGHSMGGQTARLLTELLAQGDREEIVAIEDSGSGGLSELFLGGHSWVSSITTIATPHDGTTLTTRFRNSGLLEKIFARLVASSSLKKEDPLIELHVQHWSTLKKPNESFAGFVRRVINEDLWRQTEDFSYYDLTLQGAQRLNERTSTQREVYYFSWATSRTMSVDEGGYHVPMEGMSLLLHPLARYMGSLRELPGGIDSEPQLWWENDGIVNTCSMDGPSLGRRAVIVQYSEPVTGQWNFMGTLKPLDHLQVSLVLPISGDAPPGYDSLAGFYEEWCDFLYRLPAIDD